MNQEILFLTDDLTPSEFQELIHYLWARGERITIKAIKKWRTEKHKEND